ncbi:siderophore-interacting protein [Paracoccus aestuariivivens]|uniref:Siderophore-interacting protein n=1 Tax=Paracoccus aestuariivivens TaxID=1820333 RepID=A0A6L6JEW5_9RHOB|nr:siderophore-interacting protein [Paracoccus aestuariivivens]MTH79795.1 siderophore-interacting protein [Paracoccus aestuariivivens]
MLQATTRLSHPEAIEVMHRFQQDHPEFITVDSATGPWRMVIPAGSFMVRSEEDHLSVHAEGVDAIGLSYLKLIFVDHIREYLEEDIEFVWSGDETDTKEPPFFRQITVVWSKRLTRSMQRVRFAVPDLELLQHTELHVRLLLPPKDRTPVWPWMTASGGMAWPQGDDALLARIYTLRSVDLVAGEVEIDFVLHACDAPSAGAWSMLCQPGDVAGMLGPSGHIPTASGRLLLIGDETALPAIARACEALPEDADCEILIEVNGPEDEMDLGWPVNWLHRNGAPAGTTSLLADAVRAREPSEDLYVWAGVEFGAFKDIRKHVRSVWNLPRKQHSVVAYWRSGSAGDVPEESHHKKKA